jgi:hypothetical protein
MPGMSIQLSLGKGFLRAAVLFGFMGCLVAQGNLFGAAAPSEPVTVTIETLANASAETPDFCGIALSGPIDEGDILPFTRSTSTLTTPAEIGMPDEFGVALEDEDSIEMFRFGIQQRTFALDRTAIGPKVVSKIAQATRPNISSPLLV